MGCASSTPVASDAKPKVLVLGASGYIGKSTLSSLVARHAAKVDIFAGVRDPAKFGEMPGVSVVQADMGADNVKDVLKDYDRVFIVTPGHEDRTKLTLNAIAGAKAAGVKFVLQLSVLTTETDTIFGRQFQPIEAEIKSSGLAHAIVRLPLFIDNNYASAESIKGQNTFYDPRDTSKPHTPVAVADAGKAAADILADPDKFASKTFTLVMPSFTLDDAAKAFSKALGKEVTATTVPYPAAKEAFMGMGFPEWQVDGILELFKMSDEGSSIMDHKFEDGVSDIEKITGEKPMTVEEWCEANKAGFS